jgi:integration host factor subunit beta
MIEKGLTLIRDRLYKKPINTGAADRYPARDKRGLMTKSELIDAIKNQVELSKKEAEIVVETFFKSIEEALTTGDRVEIRGFGSFAVKKYKSYTGRNPKTGKKITVSPKKLPFFKVGKELRESIDVS